MASIEFIGKWKPTTAGENLLHFMARNIRSLQVSTSTFESVLSDVPRGRSFAHFFCGCVVLHAFGRLLQASKYYRMKFPDDPSRANRFIREFIVDRLGIDAASCSRINVLVQHAFEAAEKSSKSSASASRFRKSIIRESKGLPHCYSCGAMLSPDAKKGRSDYMDLDHIWPHSFGGDTVADNLLPSCDPCNSKKHHSASWEWVLVQGMLPPTFGEDRLPDNVSKRHEKMGLHMRAAMTYARARGCTLKDAFSTIGPRLESGLETIDPGDTPDFFNLYAHDKERTEITWGELL